MDCELVIDFIEDIIIIDDLPSSSTPTSASFLLKAIDSTKTGLQSIVNKG
jgi:hypothetical protein